MDVSKPEAKSSDNSKQDPHPKTQHDRGAPIEGLPQPSRTPPSKTTVLHGFVPFFPPCLSKLSGVRAFRKSAFRSAEVLVHWEPLAGSSFVKARQVYGNLLIGCFQAWPSRIPSRFLHDFFFGGEGNKNGMWGVVERRVGSPLKGSPKMAQRRLVQC